MDSAFASIAAPIDAVMIFLNSRRATENPWAKFVGPPRLIADGTANAVRALRKHQQQHPNPNKPHIVVLSALGTGASRQVAPLLMRWFIEGSNIKYTYDDLNAVDAEIESNCGDEVDWTLVLPPSLGDTGLKPVKTFTLAKGGSGWFITRESLARWMVDLASGKLGDEFRNKRVIVSN